MKTKKMIIWLLLGLGIVIAVLVVLKIPKVPKYNNKLNMKMDCALDNVDLFEIDSLAKCDLSRELALGVEVNFSFMESRKGKTRRFSLNISSMSKRKILDEIIRRTPGYYWKEKNGVINIQPYRKGNDISPLDMTIPRFEAHQMSPYFALEYLRRLAQKHNIPITTDLYEMAVQQGVKLPEPRKIEHPENYDAEQLIDIVIPHEVSIRDCLNAIVLANSPAYWKAIKWKGGNICLHLRSSQQGYSQEKRRPTHIKSPLIETTPPVVNSDSSPF